jgi:uncharacterized lipoprotein YajG
MRALLFVAFVLLLAGASSASAIATDASELVCSPAQVAPNQNITCTIRGRDATHETTQAYPSDFMVSVRSQQNVLLTVSQVTQTNDPTLLVFTISSSLGSYVAVDATARNGRPVVGSGFQGLVFASPPTMLGTLTCEDSQLYLRSATTCTVIATGDNDVPALVTLQDIFFREDHGDGTFDMIRGDGAFVFKFTAPNSPSTKYSNFVLRVALAGSLSDPRDTSITLLYPVAPPTTRSTLTCTDSDFSHCTVNAADAGGPVLFRPEDFAIDFEEDATGGTDGNPQWTTTNAMVATWSPATAAQVASVGNVFVDQIQRDRVIRVRTHVRLASTGLELTNSPHDFVSGVPPTAQDVTFRLCARSFMIAGRTVACYLAVTSSVSAAPRFMSAAVTEGQGTVTNLIFVNGSQTGVPSLAGLRVVTFNYTAPTDFDGEGDIQSLAVTVQGIEAVRSPFRLVVFPASTGAAAEATGNSRPPVIALGLCFFGTGYLLGFFAFYRRQQRLRRVKRGRRERERIQMEAAAAKEQEEAEKARLAAHAAHRRSLTSADERAHLEMERTLAQVDVRVIQPHERSIEASDEQVPKA